MSISSDFLLCMSSDLEKEGQEAAEQNMIIAAILISLIKTDTCTIWNNGAKSCQFGPNANTD